MNIRATLLMILISSHTSFGLHVLIRNPRIMNRKNVALKQQGIRLFSEHISCNCPRHPITYLEKIRTDSLNELLLRDILDRNKELLKKLTKQNDIIGKCLQEDPANLWRYKNELYWAEKGLQLVAKD